MKNIYSLLALLFLFIGCDSNRVINKKISDFENNRWHAEKVPEFEFNIETPGLYQADVFISHVYDYALASIPLTATITGEDGKPETITLDFHIKNQQGKELGDCAGDYCDLWQPLFDNKQFEAGTYKITIAQNWDGPYLPNILSLGLKVKKQ
jgi:hypothetical protein